ncbi:MULTISPECIES: trypsin-like serine peptidase [Sphingobacterium]|uniref:trypsin-like serine peptidase n=1 Tax=Sphingobacterium TaxID=28453 RepID=UPI00257AA922|nr:MULTISPECIES: hypothetical protein [Sphingobacterium]
MKSLTSLLTWRSLNFRIPSFCTLVIFIGQLFVIQLCFAQLSTNENPISQTLKLDLKKGIDTKQTSGIPDLKRLIEEDRQDSINNRPPRFGYKIKVDWNIQNSGTWEDLPDGGRLWRFKINSPKAISINLLYDKFWLPEGGKLFIYNEGKSQTFGAFTSINNKGTKEKPGKFATALIYGDNTILEYYQPKGVTDLPIISISYVVHGYRYVIIGDQPSQISNKALSCYININCPEGSQFQIEKQAVAVIVINGNALCTGSLITTATRDMSPYFLTANHCLGSLDAVNNPDASDWTFWWNYESPNCSNPSTAPPHFTTSGATLVANYEPSDMALFRLSEDPKNLTNYNPAWVGWDRNTTSATSATGIHHPAGMIKKISLSYQNVTSYPSSISWLGGGTSPANSHWAVNFTDGTTEGGSSGSFILNQNKLIIGQLHGGDNICAPVTKYYGKIDWSWNSGTIAQRRLRDWLDPTGTGLAIAYTKQRSIIGPELNCSGSKTYTLESPPVGATITWSTYGSGVFSVSGSGATATVTKIGDGSDILQAKIGSFILAEKRITTLTSTSIQSTKYGNCNSSGWQEWFLVGNSDNGTSGWYWYTSTLPPNVQVNIYNPNSTTTWVSIKGGGGAINCSYTDNCGRPQGGGVTIYAACPTSALFKADYNSKSKKINISPIEGNNPKDYTKATYIKNIKLYSPNGTGAIVDLNYKDGGLQKIIDVPELREGRYLIEITIGDLKEMVAIDIQ